jgi:hypothetical protein
MTNEIKIRGHHLEGICYTIKQLKKGVSESIIIEDYITWGDVEQSGVLKEIDIAKTIMSNPQTQINVVEGLDDLCEACTRYFDRKTKESVCSKSGSYDRMCLLEYKLKRKVASIKPIKIILDFIGKYPIELNLSTETP